MRTYATLALLASLFSATAMPATESLGNWQSTVARLIAKNQNYPRSAQIRGEEGTTRLKVLITDDGKIDGIEIQTSSGSAILDREAQTILSSIGKFPPPPSGIHSFTVPIVWRLN